LEDLPQTIQDAIEVTRGMRMKYLWVDALCIVQDSEEDKVRNLSVMHLTYQNSLLTIVAARASSAEHGFLGSPVGRDANRADVLREALAEMRAKFDV
jgi:hypothetical protein